MRSALQLVSAAVLCLVSVAPARGQNSRPAPAVTWAPAPPFLPPGARFAVLQGDPGQAGLYTIRLELPAGYVIRPHFHPTDEHITVGGFITATAQAHHYAVARAKTVVQVHGEGPFAITYVRAADDPRAAAPRARQ